MNAKQWIFGGGFSTWKKQISKNFKLKYKRKLLKPIPSIMRGTKMIKEKQNKAGGDLMEGKEAENELD